MVVVAVFGGNGNRGSCWFFMFSVLGLSVANVLVFFFLVVRKIF